MLKDMKAALGNFTKADTTHVRMGIKRFIARVCTYGSIKYERANYLRPVGDSVADFRRFRAYLRAAQDHIGETLDLMESLQSSVEDLSEIPFSELAAACYAADTSPGNDKVGPSYLPHVAHAAASLMMGIQQAIDAGLLPKDPGPAWKTHALTEDKAEEITMKVLQVATGVEAMVDRETLFDSVEGTAAAASRVVEIEAPDESEIPPAYLDPDRCDHGRPPGVYCYKCGGWARRKLSEDKTV